MHIDYSVVKHPHPHTRKGCLARTESGSFFWWFEEPGCTHEVTCQSDYAVLAHNTAGKLVGIQKFYYSVTETTRTLEAISTFVWPLYQREGVGSSMWSKALETLDVTHVKVGVISDRGKTLIETMRARFPNIVFSVIDGGEHPRRPLRSLKKGRKKAG